MSSQENHHCYRYDLNGNLIEKVVNLEEKIKNDKLSPRCVKDCLKGKQATSHGYHWFYTKEQAMIYFDKMDDKECYKCNKKYKITESKFTQHKTVCDECFQPGVQICSYCNKTKDLKDFHFKKYHNSKSFYNKCWDCCSSKNKKQQYYKLCENPKCCNFILTTCRSNKTTGGREKKHCSKYCKKETHKENRNISIHKDQKSIIHELLIRINNHDKKKYKSKCIITSEEVQQILILQTYKCYYCKIKLLIDVGNNTSFVPSRISFDRINNEIGYTKDNINICCEMCNIGRGTMNVNLWIDIINAWQNKNECSIDLLKYGFETRTKQAGSFPWRSIYDDKLLKNDNNDDKTFSKKCRQIYLKLIQEQNFKCAITGFPIFYFTNSIKDDHCCGSHFWGSVDRLNNNTNHIESNIHITCGFINRMRNTLSLHEFKNELNKRNLNNKNINFIIPDNHNKNYINNAVNGINLSRNIVDKYKVFKIPNLQGKQIINREESEKFIKANGKEFCGEFNEHKKCAETLSLRQREITRHFRDKKNGKNTFHLKGYIFEF